MTDVGCKPETDSEDYERFLAEFGARLADAGARRARQKRKRRRTAIGGVALAVVLAAVAIVAGSGGGRVNVVAQAEAAISPAGQLLHLVTTSHLELRGGTQAQIAGSEAEGLGWNEPRVAEAWSASEPLRWRIATTIPTATAHGSTTAAPIQCAYTNGNEEIYDQAFQTDEIDVVPVTAGQDESSQESPCTDQVSRGLGTEPLAQIHSALEANQLHTAGTSTVQGRPVLRLVGQVASPDDHATVWPTEYDVDSETYAPVRFTVEMIGADTLGNTGTLTETIDVNDYEQLPLNESTTALLSIKTSGSPVVRHGINQFEARLHARVPDSAGESGAGQAARLSAPNRRHVNAPRRQVNTPRRHG